MKPASESRPRLPADQLYGGAVNVLEDVSWTTMFLFHVSLGAYVARDKDGSYHPTEMPIENAAQRS
jgi:hypothetical protein